MRIYLTRATSGIILNRLTSPLINYPDTHLWSFQLLEVFGVDMSQVIVTNINTQATRPREAALKDLSQKRKSVL